MEQHGENYENKDLKKHYEVLENGEVQSMNRNLSWHIKYNTIHNSTSR